MAVAVPVEVEAEELPLSFLRKSKSHPELRLPSRLEPAERRAQRGLPALEQAGTGGTGARVLSVLSWLPEERAPQERLQVRAALEEITVR